jgi:hypothetical protein
LQFDGHDQRPPANVCTNTITFYRLFHRLCIAVDYLESMTLSSIEINELRATEALIKTGWSESKALIRLPIAKIKGPKRPLAEFFNCCPRAI